MSDAETCPTCGRPWPASEDNRNKLWRVRIRLYGERSADEPEADSDPDLEPGAPGTLLLRGLPEVASELARTATAFHKAGTLLGLGPELLNHRLKALRPTLSRRGGNAAWRVKYQTPAGEMWLARVDIQRENEQ